MQKVIFLTESQREELEDFFENDDKDIEEYDEADDFYYVED